MPALQNALISLSLAISAYALTLTPEMLIQGKIDAIGGDLATTTRQQILKTLVCESGLVPQQSRHTKNGVREDSWGIAQIHLPSHPEVTREMAMDENFAIAFIVTAVRNGHQNWWTCWPKPENRPEQ